MTVIAVSSMDSHKQKNPTTFVQSLYGKFIQGSDAMWPADCFLLLPIRNYWAWFSHRKKKKIEGERAGLVSRNLPLGWGKEKDWSWKLLINENCFGRSVSVIITYRRGQQIICPWKPLFSTSAVPQHSHSLAWVSPDSHHKANYLELSLLPKMCAKKKKKALFSDV